ncbi:MAG: NAD(P)/FAD-dependent oxidoreductase [Myxococcota bacterium]
MSTPHVLVIGGGFGGLGATRALRKAPVRITLIDRSNHHLFQPLLYQVATASLAPSDIAEPIRAILRRQSNVSVRLGEVAAIDLAGHAATLTDGSTISWDKLVIAAGVSHSYFGNDGWAAHAPGLKTLTDAFEIRRRVLTAFEQAEWETDPARRNAAMTFVVIGGGPTGVELAGALAEISFWTLRRDFRNIETTKARVILLEAGPDVLPGFDPGLRVKAKEQLQRLGVQVWVDRKVTGIDASGVSMGAERLEAGTVLWAAGVQGEPLARTLGVPLDRAGRVPVAQDCSVPGHPDAFVIGDLAQFVPSEGARPLPGVAQVAMQMGDHVGRAIAGDVAGKTREPFGYHDKGSLATIGRSKAVADLGFVKLGGFFAWFVWAFVHVVFLITFRNRILVMTKWATAWFTYERASRLIWRVPERR